MKIRSGFGLGLKMTLFAAILVIVTTVIFASVVINRETNMINREILSKGMSIGSAFYGVAVNNIQNNQFYTIEEGFLAVTKQNKDISYLMLIDKNGKIYVHSNPNEKGKVLNDQVTQMVLPVNEPAYVAEKQPTGDKIYHIAIPVTSDLERWGLLRIGLSNTNAQVQIANSRNYAVGLSLILTFIGIGGALAFGKTVTGPIKSLVASMNQIAAGDFTGEIKVRSSDETGLLADSVNTMLQSVKRLISEVKNAGQQIIQASHQLSGHASQTAEFTENVAATIEQLAEKNSQQAEDVTETTRTIEQLNLAVSQIASGAQEQAGNINNTSSLVNDMAGAIQELATNTRNISETANKTADVANMGMKTVGETMDGMDRIKAKVFETAGKLRELAGNSEKIGEIIMVIDEIADQTNLLALNAAIEAARAGEYGKGFAVVADEVRKLAERSGKAAREIAELVKIIQDGTGRSVKAMEEGIREVENGTELGKNADLALKEIASHIDASNEFMQHISEAAEHIANNSEQVVASIENLAAIAQENSASAEEMAAGSDQALSVISNIASSVDMTAQLSEKVSASTREMVNTSTEIAGSSRNLERLAQALELSISKFKT